MAALDRFMPLLRFLKWVLTTVVVPLTIWFTVLRGDVNATAKDVARVEADLNQAKIEMRSDREKLFDKMNEMQRSIGHVEGIVERIERRR